MLIKSVHTFNAVGKLHVQVKVVLTPTPQWVGGSPHTRQQRGVSDSQRPPPHRWPQSWGTGSTTGVNAVTGESSTASGNVDTSYASTLLGVTFASGLANPEIENNSGNVIYVENRRLINRAPDQIEVIKLVIEL